ncbi:conserved hypothetical protein, internal deletion [Methylococcus capsulatus str. Bath]|uniref:Uncharacterized protein n=1 Tax=Methylococcus capsulatus (strain ATCC 33009 / NCIMB 11132 / Bath) TaxID=243233 RepID=Q60CA6_METCA|nr:conserved hypothetical protein, internal deletion [Methylococcus capsulatus str. Bath]
MVHKSAVAGRPCPERDKRDPLAVEEAGGDRERAVPRLDDTSPANVGKISRHRLEPAATDQAPPPAHDPDFNKLRETP